MGGVAREMGGVARDVLGGVARERVRGVVRDGFKGALTGFGGAARGAPGRLGRTMFGGTRFERAGATGLEATPAKDKNVCQCMFFLSF